MGPFNGQGGKYTSLQSMEMDWLLDNVYSGSLKRHIRNGEKVRVGKMAMAFLLYSLDLRLGQAIQEATHRARVDPLPGRVQRQAREEKQSGPPSRNLSSSYDGYGRAEARAKPKSSLER